MRGEKCTHLAVSGAAWGSPPHARGKAYRRVGDVDPFGITPACAGKRSGQRRYTAGIWDHPRMRGEKYNNFYRINDYQGSPPHARGKACGALLQMLRSGITPACAGKRDRGDREDRPIGDHPRMRGEKLAASGEQEGRVGSPPHARGKARSDLDCAMHFGITPACAGKSRNRSPRVPRLGDHPRMRGEKPVLVNDEPDREGSPPHARGKDYPQGAPCSGFGITPACAGKRICQSHLRFLRRDHPRMRGEKSTRATAERSRPGSPPHARGKVLLLGEHPGGCGITPACAGKR